jgi:hypothetical protein
MAAKPSGYYRMKMHFFYGNIEKKLKNGVFWDVTPCGSFRNHRFGGT